MGLEPQWLSLIKVVSIVVLLYLWWRMTSDHEKRHDKMEKNLESLGKRVGQLEKESTENLVAMATGLGVDVAALERDRKSVV